MKYRLENFVLDREGGVLTRDGIPVDITWRALICIAWLVEQRHRVVGYDELIRKVWGHGDATNHQLSQVVLAARRALGDDGQAQRIIRTIPGHGYRWLGPASELTERDSIPDAVLGAPLAETPVETSSHGVPSSRMTLTDEGVDPEVGVRFADVEPSFQSVATRDGSYVADGVFEASPEEMSAASIIQSMSAGEDPAESNERTVVTRRPVLRKYSSLMFMGLALAVTITTAVVWPDDSDRLNVKAAQTHDPHAASLASGADPLTSIEELLLRGDIDGARRQLTVLPANLVNSPDARILEIRLEMGRGRFDHAALRIEFELQKSKAAGDVVWRVRLLALQSIVASHLRRPALAVSEPGRQAVALLESQKSGDVPQSVYAQAFYARGIGFLQSGEYDAALKDLLRSRDSLLNGNDKQGVMTVRHSIAYAWLRMGRLNDALNEFKKIAEDARQLRDSTAETSASNSAARLQIELLQWDEVLANTGSIMAVSSRVFDPIHHLNTVRLRAIALINTGSLREAAVLLEGVDRADYGDKPSIAQTMYYLARGEHQNALVEALALFPTYSQDDRNNLIFQSQEGALLLWAMAAHGLAQAGQSPPNPSMEQMEILNRPQTIQGRIARGWWLCAKGGRGEAERELRQALEESRQQGRIFYATLAAEPLVALLLERGDVAAAEDAIATVRGLNPSRIDRDYRVALLRLQIALAKKDVPEIEKANQIVGKLAGDRKFPVIHHENTMLVKRIGQTAGEVRY